MARKIISSASPPPPQRSGRSKKVTVVLVDDDFQMRRALGRLLREHGFNVTSFERPSEVLSSRLPTTDVILLLDIHLPEMSGISLSAELHSNGVNLPTILMTGHRDELATIHGAHTGANATLFKPIEEKALLEALRSALRQSVP